MVACRGTTPRTKAISPSSRSRRTWLSSGATVLIPLTEHAPFDLIAYVDELFFRVQVKFRTELYGAVQVVFESSWADRHGSAHKRPMPRNEVDVVAIYCPETALCYYVDPSRFGRSVTLRVQPARNGQAKRILPAEQYLRNASSDSAWCYCWHPTILSAGGTIRRPTTSGEDPIERSARNRLTTFEACRGVPMTASTVAPDHPAYSSGRSCVYHKDCRRRCDRARGRRSGRGRWRFRRRWVARRSAGSEIASTSGLGGAGGTPRRASRMAFGLSRCLGRGSGR